jgi:cold-inducible RNA-binding protein
LVGLLNKLHKEKIMGRKLYIGGLSYNTKDDTLRDLFSQAGTVESAAVIMDRDSGRSKGFGFVEMSSEQDVSKAIDLFNEKELDGRNITLNEARPQEKRHNSGGFGGRRNYGRNTNRGKRY